MTSAYNPLQPAQRPGSKPEIKPRYRVLVHKRFQRHWDELAERVGLQQAQQFWDHVSQNPGDPAPVASTCLLKGKAGKPAGEGWSRTVHYEISGSARIDYQFHDEYVTAPKKDKHRVVAILTISFGSH